MDENLTAVYLLVRADELQPEDEGSYERPLAKQKEECMKFIEERLGSIPKESIQVYSNIDHLLMDVARRRIKRLVVKSLDRLGSGLKEREGILFELKAEGIELLTLDGSLDS